MPGLTKAERGIPFPEIPDALKREYECESLSLRPFGSFASDLEINFLSPRPWLVTELLRNCALSENKTEPNRHLFWKLPIGKRTEAIYALATLPLSGKMDIPLRCSKSDCTEWMEFNISTQELADFQKENARGETLSLKLEEQTVQIRKPTGEDQMNWFNYPFASEAEMVETMVQALVIKEQTVEPISKPVAVSQEESIAPQWLLTIEEELETVDPLVNFKATLTCPYCGQPGLYPINLEELALKTLQQIQNQMFDTVHRLASHYHWTEQEIFSIPIWRRNHYLALIDKETN